MHRNRELGWAAVVGTALVLVLAIASPASARKFQMSGTWLMRKGQAFIPLQFGGSLGGTQMTHASMGLFTEAPFSPPGQVVIGLGGVEASGTMAPNKLKVPKHRWVSSHAAVIPLSGVKLIQITTNFGIDAPFSTANLAKGAGPGALVWCPSNPACAATGLPPGPIGNNGRVVYTAGANQFGGTMQMGLLRGGLVSVPAGGGLAAHLPFGGSGTTLRKLAVGGMQAGPDTPFTERVILAQGILTAPTIFPPMGSLILYPGPYIGKLPTIMTPNGAPAGQFTTNWAFGHTTGTVLAQQVTGTGGDDFFAVMGSDMRTALGAGNISIVAGGLARRNTLSGNTHYAQFDRISMSMGAPVPSMSPAGFATAGVLILLAVGYALRRRLA